MSCHENGGRDPDYRGSGSARLAAQRMDYLREQLRAYLGGQRKFLLGVKRQSFLGQPISVRGGQVREQLNPISESEVEAIVHFLASNPIDDAKLARRRMRR
jgi:cytochrome c553